MRLALPLKTVNRTNAREHWGETAKRTKRERNTVALLLKPKLSELGSTRLVVSMTRVGPNELDDDGLRAALKGVRDGIAAALRIDDASPLVRWDYSQRKGEHGIDVCVEWGSATTSPTEYRRAIDEPHG